MLKEGKEMSEDIMELVNGFYKEVSMCHEIYLKLKDEYPDYNQDRLKFLVALKIFNIVIVDGINDKS